MEPNIQIPTCGRIVNYIPVLPDILKHNNHSFIKALPAIVIEATDLYVNMTVFSLSNPAEGRYSVPHISVVTKDEHGNALLSYWEWPSRG